MKYLLLSVLSLSVLASAHAEDPAYNCSGSFKDESSKVEISKDVVFNTVRETYLVSIPVLNPYELIMTLNGDNSVSVILQKFENGWTKTLGNSRYDLNVQNIAYPFVNTSAELDLHCSKI